ncbi:helix-turn-helix domain-containing protein [Streptomyces aquilus]|uniref:helix-turn-helix domain-containing protein n=1 Tax=Streptomyces aquilus TaxID=2548456 RepID=UPI0037CCF13B
MTPSQVARRLRLSRKSAYAWHARWRDGGVSALRSKGPTARGWVEDQRWTLGRFRSRGLPNATRTRWPRGSKRRGHRRKVGEAPGRVAVLRGLVGTTAQAPKARPWSRCTTAARARRRAFGRRTSLLRWSGPPADRRTGRAGAGQLHSPR